MIREFTEKNRSICGKLLPITIAIVLFKTNHDVFQYCETVVYRMVCHGAEDTLYRLGLRQLYWQIFGVLG